MPTVFLWNGGFAFFSTFFGLNLLKRIPGFTPSDIADFFSFIGICIVLVQVILTPFIAKHFKNYQVIRFTLIGMSLTLLILLTPHTTSQLYSVGWLLPIFVGLSMANVISLVSSVAGPKIQGEVMGINSSVESLAQAIPQALSGYIASVSLGLPIYLASLTVFLAAIFFFVLFRGVHQNA